MTDTNNLETSDISNEPNTFTDKKLSSFLRNLADSIESEKLDDEKKQIVGEFYMKYKFCSSNKKLFEEINQEDVRTFFFLGWFIYCVILKDKRFKKLCILSP
jgi:hypothetical protein